jgi:hypothetical protein
MIPAHFEAFFVPPQTSDFARSGLVSPRKNWMFQMCAAPVVNKALTISPPPTDPVQAANEDRLETLPATECRPAVSEGNLSAFVSAS